MGEPGDDALFQERHDTARQELPDGDGAIYAARRDTGLGQALTVRYLQDTTSLLSELITAVNNNTRAVVALAKLQQRATQPTDQRTESLVGG